MPDLFHLRRRLLLCVNRKKINKHIICGDKEGMNYILSTYYLYTQHFNSTLLGC